MYVPYISRYFQLHLINFKQSDRKEQLPERNSGYKFVKIAILTEEYIWNCLVMGEKCIMSSSFTEYWKGYRFLIWESDLIGDTICISSYADSITTSHMAADKHLVLSGSGVLSSSAQEQWVFQHSVSYRCWPASVLNFYREHSKDRTNP